MDLNLKGKVVLVSGSTSGVGKATAEVLLKEGCIVFINGRKEQALKESSRELGGKVYEICSDLTVTSNINNAFSIIYEKTGKHPDIVIANIGSGRSVMGWDVDDEEWLRVFNINFFGTVRLCREAIRNMEKNKYGNIVCISSITGCEAISAPVPYSTAKAAVLSFVKNTSDVVAKHGIRINAISPGNVLFEGGIWDKKIKENKNEVLNYINNEVPLQGFATPYDIANMAAYLVSDLAKFITGSNFIIDGGQVRKFI